MENAIQKTNGQPAPQAGQIQRREFGADQLAVPAETAASAVAAQARAAIESRYVMAMRRPRDLLGVRSRLLEECKRKGFADAAIYSKPVGEKPIEGPSIRFAEAAIRCMTNILPETATIYDDAEKRILRVTVTDLETNVTYSKDVVVEKVVERKFLRNGQVAISERTNSAGQKTYLVEASEDALLNKEGALLSKAMRSLALRLLPGDILDECMALCQATLRDQAAKDPAGERKKIADAFSGIGVQPEMLRIYLGHALDTCSPAELVELRKVYAAIRDGESNWQDALEQKQRVATSSSTAPPAPGEPSAETVVAAAEQTQDAPPPVDPLADFRAALSTAKTPKDRMAAMKLVANMPTELQAQARDLFNAMNEG